MADNSHKSLRSTGSKWSPKMSPVMTSRVYPEIFILVEVMPDSGVHVSAVMTGVVRTHESVGSGPLGVVQTSSESVGSESVWPKVLFGVGTAVQSVVAVVEERTRVADAHASAGEGAGGLPEERI